MGKLDEGGLVNAIIGLKTTQSGKNQSVLSDLEKMLLGNIKSLSLDSISQVFHMYTRNKGY